MSSSPMIRRKTSTIFVLGLAHAAKSAKNVRGECHDIEAVKPLRDHCRTRLLRRICLQSGIGRVSLLLPSLQVLSLGRAVSLGSAAYGQSRCHQRAAHVDVNLLAGAYRLSVLLLDFRPHLWLSPRNVPILGLVGHRAPCKCTFELPL